MMHDFSFFLTLKKYDILRPLGNEATDKYLKKILQKPDFDVMGNEFEIQNRDHLKAKLVT